MTISYIKKIRFLFTFFIILIFSYSSYASVVMNGTRIVYHAADKSADVTLNNKSEFPYVVQVWLDEGDMSITPNDHTNIPFFITPSVFRIDPNASQLIRIVYTKSQPLPQDRESVFYFNFLEIPPANIDNTTNSSKNKILITLRNRVKLFYRPAKLQGSPNDLLQILKIKKIASSKALKIEIENPSPFYVSLNNLDFITTNKTVSTNTTTEMIPPFSSESFIFDTIAADAKGEVSLTIINDLGARLSERYPLGM